MMMTCLATSRSYLDASSCMLFRAGTVGISSMDRRYLFLFTYVPRSTVDRNQIQNLFGTKWGRVTEREQGTCSRDRRIYTIRFSCQEWISPASTQGGRTPYPSNSDPHSSRTSSTRRNTTSQRFRYSSAFGNHHRFATPVCLEIKDELAVCGRTSEERGQGGHGFLVQKRCTNAPGMIPCSFQPRVRFMRRYASLGNDANSSSWLSVRLTL
ncbi:hypothetical protein V8E55_004283 [Tylopilus felleus]